MLAPLVIPEFIVIARVRWPVRLEVGHDAAQLARIELLGGALAWIRVDVSSSPAGPESMECEVRDICARGPLATCLGCGPLGNKQKVFEAWIRSSTTRWTGSEVGLCGVRARESQGDDKR